VYEKTWPTCSDPDTVGGGVSMLKTCDRARAGSPSGRTNAYVPSVRQVSSQRSSSPSRAGRSGIAGAGAVVVTRSNLR
jgi:hypothetical protein